jgi:hypothetical protein
MIEVGLRNGLPPSAPDAQSPILDELALASALCAAPFSGSFDGRRDP